MTTEECLIIGFSNQEQQSLIELYNRYSRLLWKISYRVVADEAISEQIVRKSFGMHGKIQRNLITEKIINFID